MYEVRLQSSWTHLITQSGNFVKLRLQCLFRSTSHGKSCISYNALPTSRKLSYGRFKRTLFRMAEQPKRSVSISRLKSGNGCPHRDRWNPMRTSAIQFRSRPMRFLGFSNHENGTRRTKPLYYPPEACDKLSTASF
jgi:hypothetical protein